MKLFLLYDDVDVHWKKDLTKLFKQRKNSKTRSFTHIKPKTKHPFLINVDADSSGNSCAIYPKLKQVKLVVILYSPRVLTATEGNS